MKRCPECRRDYDNSMMFCLDDGAELLYGPAASEAAAAVVDPLRDEPQTAILHETAPPIEAETQARIHTTEQTSVFPPVITEHPKKGFDKRLLLVPIALAMLILGGITAYRYFTLSNQIESIAVMPFINESGNADVEYLSDGMTEALISSLMQLPNLNVKARSSVFRYKGQQTDLKTIGKELNVQAILTGRVAERGDQLALSLELVDVATENAIWSQQYNRKQSDLVSLQSEIARDVSGKLKAKLSGAEVAKVEKTYTADSEAYQLYLKGKFYWNNRTGESLKKAIEFYQQAIEKDPNYALAYSGLAETFVLFSSYDVAAADDSMPQAKAAARRALEIDDSLAEAHTALAFYLDHYEWDRTGAEQQYRRAIELNPNYSTAHHWYSANLSNVRRFEDSLAELKRAEQLDPLSPIIGTNLGDNLVNMRRFDDAIAQYKRVIAIHPDFGMAHQGLATAYGLKGMYQEAIGEARLAVQERGGTGAKGYLGLWLARSGKREEVGKLLSELQQDAAAGNYVQGYPLALIYLGLGDKEHALDWLEKHMASRAETASTYAANAELDELRAEPRFIAMLRRMNLPQ